MCHTKHYSLEMKIKVLVKLKMALTKHVRRFNKCGVQVGPVESPLSIVNGEPISTTHIGDQRDAAWTVHGCAVYLGSPSPLCPVHKPGKEMQPWPSVLDTWHSQWATEKQNTMHTHVYLYYEVTK